MTDREKLVKLLCEASSLSVDAELFEDSSYAQQLEIEADFLIANGVTVQRWIPVTERLPEDDLPKGSNVKQIKVLTALKSDNGVRTVRSQMRFRCTWYSDCAPWAWKYSGSEITHWMPMPEPPRRWSDDLHWKAMPNAIWI